VSSVQKNFFGWGSGLFCLCFGFCFVGGLRSGLGLTCV